MNIIAKNYPENKPKQKTRLRDMSVDEFKHHMKVNAPIEEQPKRNENVHPEFIVVLNIITQSVPEGDDR